MGNKYKAIVFDWDGTLFDSQAVAIDAYCRAVEHVLKQRLEADEVLKYSGSHFETATRSIFPEIKDNEIDRLKNRFECFVGSPECGKSMLFPDAAVTIEKLKNRGYELAISTNRELHTLKRDLELTQLDEFFKVRRCADANCAKPHQDMLLDVLLELGLEKHEILFIGDSVYDIELAQNADVDLLLVNNKSNKNSYGDLPRLIDVLSSLSEIPIWLDKHVYEEV